MAKYARAMANHGVFIIRFPGHNGSEAAGPVPTGTNLEKNTHLFLFPISTASVGLMELGKWPTNEGIGTSKSAFFFYSLSFEGPLLLQTRTSQVSNEVAAPPYLERREHCKTRNYSTDRARRTAEASRHHLKNKQREDTRNTRL
jgi:hypothetical protein